MFLWKLGSFQLSHWDNRGYIATFQIREGALNAPDLDSVAQGALRSHVPGFLGFVPTSVTETPASVYSSVKWVYYYSPTYLRV